MYTCLQWKVFFIPSWLRAWAHYVGRARMLGPVQLKFQLMRVPHLLPAGDKETNEKHGENDSCCNARDNDNNWASGCRSSSCPIQHGFAAPLHGFRICHPWSKKDIYDVALSVAVYILLDAAAPQKDHRLQQTRRYHSSFLTFCVTAAAALASSFSQFFAEKCPIATGQCLFKTSRKWTVLKDHKESNDPLFWASFLYW